MLAFLDDFGITAPQTATDEEEEEEVEEEQPQEKEQPKVVKPSIDHSIKPRERITKERDNLKFESVVMASMQRQAAKILGDLILWEFDNYPEREHEWDYNEWTLVDFLDKFAEEARKAVKGNVNQALFAGNTDDPEDPTMELLRSIIHEKNEPKKTSSTAPSKKEAKAKPKKEEKPNYQLHLDLGDF